MREKKDHRNKKRWKEILEPNKRFIRKKQEKGRRWNKK